MGGEFMDKIYKGYKVLTGTSKEINEYMSEINTSIWNYNEYLIIRNSDDDSEKEMRWDGEKFVSLKLPPSKFIKAKNALQRCALDMLNNKEITICVVLGTYGSGKSFLVTRMADYCVRGEKVARKDTLKVILSRRIIFGHCQLNNNLMGKSTKLIV